MGGFFGTISRKECKSDLFYGTDYNSHLGTKRGGMAMYDRKVGFSRSIHNLENSYFRSKFEPNLSKYAGNAGIGVISDTDAQPIVINSHLGRFAIVTIACINNIEALAEELLAKNKHFSELSSGKINQTELVALLITEGKSIKEGIISHCLESLVNPTIECMNQLLIQLMQINVLIEWKTFVFPYKNTPNQM